MKMAKPKFTLTSDLVKVEPEPHIPSLPNPEPMVRKVIIAKEAINVHISRDLKKRFQMWCLMRERSMTESVEEALEKLMKD